MARISQEEKEQNQAHYDAVIFELFITEGWEAVTLDRVAKECGIRKSTLQGYYKNKDQFAYALQGKIFPMFAGKLDFQSAERFKASWRTLHSEDRVFREVVLMLIDNIVSRGGSEGTRGAIIRLVHVLSVNITEEAAEQAVKEALGETLFGYAFQK